MAGDVKFLWFNGESLFSRKISGTCTLNYFQHPELLRFVEPKLEIKQFTFFGLGLASIISEIDA